MHKQWIVGASAFSALILIVAATLSFGARRPPAVPQQDDAYPVPREVVVAHAVDSGGTHTFSGSVPMTSTCNIVSSGISTDEADKSLNVSLALRILTATEGNCKDAADGTMQTFYAAFNPSDNARSVVLSALTLNGKPVQFVEQ